jgi:prepilin-type N-terminal cleavage/methylation domain-containing protein
MEKNTSGFTLFELVVVLVLGTVLTGIAFQGFSGARSRLSVRQARDVYAALAARTRAHAIEGGGLTLLITDARGDSVMIFKDGSIVENVRFAEMNVDIRSEAPVTTVCMNARGFASSWCTSISTTTEILFAQGTESEVVKVFPLGQVRW